ncbi:MAG: hypothetical protein AAB460_01470 [Patescibacteria group bacterium]
MKNLPHINVKKFLHRPHPTLAFAWLTVLVVCGILIIGSAVYAAFVFKRVLGSDALPENVSAPIVETINREELVEVLAAFRRRVTEFERRTSTVPTIPDPSR